MKALIDNLSKEELEALVKDCSSMRELSRRIGYASSGSNPKTIQKRLDDYHISTAHFTGQAKNAIKRSEDNIFIENSTANQTVLRRWYFKGNYTEYKCAICGQEPIWNNMPLTLTLDHINGNNHDDRLENLRWICPNCDRQLPTFAGKNADHNLYYNYQLSKLVIGAKKEKEKAHRPSKEELFDTLTKYQGNFTKVGQIYDVTDNAVRKWCKAYGLPYHSPDYKKTQQSKVTQYQYKVEQINKETNQIIAIYDSCAAAEKATGISHITEASDPTNQKRLTAGGYLWHRIEQIKRN